MTPAPPPLPDALLALYPCLEPGQFVPLRGGRVNRLWRAGDLVLKLYDPHGASPLFPNDPAAEARALRLLAGSNLAPGLLAEGADWIAYRHVPGPLWSGDPRGVARALTAVHRAPAQGFRILPSGSAALLAQAGAIAADCKGHLPPAPADPGLAPVAAGLIHGDAVAGNMICTAGGVTLIDWQCPALGDAAEDLAAFLSPAMQWLYRGTVLNPTEEEAFLEASAPETAARYRQLRPLFHWRMAAHCLWKAERGAADYRTALAMELAALTRTAPR